MIQGSPIGTKTGRDDSEFDRDGTGRLEINRDGTGRDDSETGRDRDGTSPKRHIINIFLKKGLLFHIFFTDH